VRSLRIVSILPQDRSLPLHDALRPLGSGQFGQLDIVDATQREEAELVRAVHKAMTAGLTVGLCPLSTRIKAVFFDMDSTVILEESIVELARAAGSWETVARITERAMAGELDFETALRERVATLKGLPVSVLSEVSQRLTLAQGIQAFAGFAREIQLPLFLVSGGFSELAATVARRVGFDGWFANQLEIKDGLLTGGLEGPVVDAATKRTFLEATCLRLGIKPEQVCAVGDGANDIPMLKAAGVAVGFAPKPVLLEVCDGANFSGDHRFLAPLLFGRDVSVRRSSSPS
jgi:phosphoserine phosphatase